MIGLPPRPSRRNSCGLNYHLPYPIESVLTPKVTRVNRIDIGVRLIEDFRRGTTMHDMPEESLMLTGAAAKRVPAKRTRREISALAVPVPGD